LREFVHSALGDGADIDCAIVRGNAVNALVTAAHESALLVVGEPRNGTINRVRSSLVAPQVVLKSRCPVVVMPTAAASAG
jgi:nucleotide-binding universal stress UspA family protein